MSHPLLNTLVWHGKRIVKNLFLRPPRAREKNYHSISASLTRTRKTRIMSRLTLTGFALASVLFFGNNSENYAAQPKQYTSDAVTGTLQKMIVENGSVTLNLDLNGLDGS